MAARMRRRRWEVRRQYPDDPIREVLETIKDGDAVLLNKVLQEMSSSERAFVLKATDINSRSGTEYPVIHGYPGGYTAMHYAACLSRGSCDVLSCLLQNGADVNVRSAGSAYGKFAFKCTPLMAACECDNLNAVEFLLKHGAKIDLQDRRNKTSLHYGIEKVIYGDDASFDVLSCLLNHGAAINAPTNGKFTPLMIASQFQHVRLVNFLLQHGANVLLKDKDGKTALHFACETAAAGTSCNLLSCLIENGADINALRKDNCTPLMEASSFVDVDQVTFLIEHGANVHLQDKNGDTALHHAARNLSNSSEIACALIAAGASQMCNNQGLTPLLVASNHGNDVLVEGLIKRPDVTKEQRIDALELLGASMTIKSINHWFNDLFSRACSYIRRGMEERFADPLHPVLKQTMEPIDAYQNRKESQSLEELEEIGENRNVLTLESLLIKERVLGKNNAELLKDIRDAARHFEDDDQSTCIGLFKHAFNTAQSCNQSALQDISSLRDLLEHVMYEEFWSDQQKQAYVVELLEQIVYEFEKINKSSTRKKKSKVFQRDQQELLRCSIDVLSFVCNFQYFEVGEASPVSVLTRRLCALNPRGYYGSTLLHKAIQVYQSFPDSMFSLMKMLLNSRLNVNATDSKGNTPLHFAVALEPRYYENHLADLLEMLLDRGAHQDFVNHDGKSAMDLAKTEVARSILCEKRKLELKCISARAIKRFGLPYLGVVPKILEKFISMH